MKKRLFSLLMLLSFLQIFAQNYDAPLETWKTRILPGRNVNNPPLTVNQSKIDVLFYDLSINVDVDNEFIEGITTTRLSVLSPTDKIDYDLSAFMTVDSVFVNGILTDNHIHARNLLTITLSDTVASDSLLQSKVYYHGAPSSSGFGSFEWSQSYVDGYKVFWTLSEPYGAKDWWPSKNTPTDKPDSVYIHVNVPSGYKVASNGLLQETINSGDRDEYFWIHRYPIATYLVAIAGAPYVEINDTYHSNDGWDMPLQHYIYPSWDNANTREDLELVKEMISAYNYYFGDYPFKNEKYGIAQFGWGGGMEHQTITYQSGFGKNLSSHELGHQWFGDNVTCADFHHIWLNEGFASYTEAAFNEWLGGEEGYMAYFLGSFYFPSLAYTDPIYVQNVDENDPNNTQRIFSRIVYSKGACIVHMLRRLINDDEVFRQLLIGWNSPQSGYGDSSATTEDFSRFVSDFTGKDYSWFFDDWIYQPYHPVYAVNWENGDNGMTVVKISQVQDAATWGFYRMDVPIKFSNSTRDTTIKLFNDTQDQIFILDAGFIPTSLEVDPNYSVLKEIEGVYQLIRGIIPEDFTLLGNYPNPFPNPSNPQTQIRYYVPQPGIAEIEIYNELGQSILNIINTNLHQGINAAKWDGRDRQGHLVSSGIYFYRVSFSKDPSHKETKTGKIVLIK